MQIKNLLLTLLLLGVGIGGAGFLWKQGYFTAADATSIPSPIPSVSEETANSVNFNLREMSDEEKVNVARQAQELAKQSKFREAIEVLDQIRTSKPTEVLILTQLRQRWAREIFNRATAKYEQGNPQEALRLASSIPDDTPAQSDFDRVQATWAEGSAFLKTSSNLLEQEKCNWALNILNQVSDPPLKQSSGYTQLRQKIQDCIDY